MNDIKKVTDYLDQAGTFYVTTEDGNKPKCRPFSFKLIYEGKIYFGVGDFKDCYKQLTVNPNVEICASDGKGFVRYYGRAEFVDDPALLDAAFKSVDYLDQLYNEATGNKLKMFYLADATAEFRSLTGLLESIKI